jgi:hypothetical protein
MEYYVGKTLFFKGHNDAGYHDRYVEVTKIGRKWVELSNRQRVLLTSVDVDGGEYSSPGRLYETLEDYQKELEIKKAWYSFVNCLAHTNPPEGMTLEKIDQLRVLVGLKK